MDRGKDHMINIFTAILIAVYVYTALSKWLDYELFEYRMMRQPLPAELSYLLVWVLPPAELVTAGLLFYRKTRFAGFIFSLILMTAFTGYVALALAGVYGEVPCSCGGILDTLSWGQHLVVNIFLLGISAYGNFLIKYRYRKT